MRNSWIIARRELRERIGSRSFLIMAFTGPLLVLSLVYLLFITAGDDRQKWKVLIADPAGIMEERILFRENPNVNYSFIAKYVEIEDFAKGKDYEDFDALIEINEKVLSNKLSYIFYREKPSVTMMIDLRYHVERRLEEVVAAEFTDLTAKEFREIKQPITLSFRNVYDPKNESSSLAGWVGMVFGGLIFLFIFLFGMTILRSVSREKSNRIVEILVSTVHPRSLMLGKVAGVGISALIQFIIWFVIIGIGLYFIRENLFPDMYDGSTVAGGANSYNEFVELVFSRISFSGMLTWFLLFFIAGYLFYGAFFAALGAVSGSESDGQQFLLPLIALLLFALYSGYYAMSNPDSSLTAFYQYFPFTAPVVAMVKLAVGYAPGQGYQIVVSLFILLISSFIVLTIAGRLYKNGLLQFGHSLRFRQLRNWIKRS